LKDLHEIPYQPSSGSHLLRRHRLR
jgi:hypothetical protein